MAHVAPKGRGGRIRLAREASGLSRDALGIAIGVRGQTIYRWEREDIAPRADTLSRLADALSVDVRWLLTGRGRKPAAAHEARP